jgi:hypothetical protein
VTSHPEAGVSLLLAELQHRVRNLAVVRSLAWRTVETTPPS